MNPLTRARRLVAGRVKAAFRRAGLEVRDLRRMPAQTFLGLRSRPVHTVIDVGANTGQFARHAITVFPEARFHCFEPLPGSFAELDAWAHTTAGRVTAYNLALGTEDGELEFHEHPDHPTSSSILATTAVHTRETPEIHRQTRRTVPVRRLDAVLAAAGALKPELVLKLDVQGYEAHVLRGAPDTLRAARACIAEVCLDPLYEGQATFVELLDLARAAGLEYAGNLDQVYAADGHVAFFDAVFMRPG